MKDALASTFRQVARARPETLVDILWACAKLDHNPGKVFIQVVTEKTARSLPMLGTYMLGQLLWSFAKMNHHPGVHFMSEFVAALSRSEGINEMRAGQVTTVMWAFARLDHRPPVSLSEALLRQAEERTDDIEAHELASLLWSCSRMDLRLPDPLLQALPTKPSRDLASFGPRGLAYVLWLYGKLGAHPGEDFVERAIARMGRTVPAFSYIDAKDLANLLWACVKLDHLPGEGYLRALDAAILNRMEESTPAQLATYLWGFSELGHVPSQEFQEAWLRRAGETLADFGEAERATSRSAARRVGARGVDGLLGPWAPSPEVAV
ncbi:unnamed protein product [Prorocentrum cordatum]|uniref:Uncharacterized protein n=1 Tax=Prorocentrum cordatum TaxID=2364126 RepID=A0ABN9PA92_9DINO|nr:unnamed protein product [Polarella glacialis]